MEPVLRLLARYARRKGIDRELEQRYVAIPSVLAVPAPTTKKETPR